MQEDVCLLEPSLSEQLLLEEQPISQEWPADLAVPSLPSLDNSMFPDLSPSLSEDFQSYQGLLSKNGLSFGYIS